MIGLGWNPTRRDLRRSRTTGRHFVTYLPSTSDLAIMRSLTSRRKSARARRDPTKAEYCRSAKASVMPVTRPERASGTKMAKRVLYLIMKAQVSRGATTCVAACGIDCLLDRYSRDRNWHMHPRRWLLSAFTLTLFLAGCGGGGGGESSSLA